MRIVLSVTLLFAVQALAQEGKTEETPAAAKTRKLLRETKISVDFKDTRLEDAMDEIKEMVKGLKILLDSKGGVSRNRTVTYKASNKSVEAIFDEMFKKLALGYIIKSEPGTKKTYDGVVIIRQSDERGYEKKK